MSDVNKDMEATADYVIKSARERYSIELDYSRASIAGLETILGRIYWGFSGRTEDEGKGGVIYNAAIFWGSYLGEFMRRKWGGTWVQSGSELIVSINGIDFSPINYVYEKITGRVNNKIADYLFETNGKLSTSGSLPLPENKKVIVEEFAEPMTVKKPLKIDKNILYAIIGISGILLVLIIFIIFIINFQRSGIPSTGIIALPTRTSTNIPAEFISFTPTTYLTNTASPTITMLPTYTPIPTQTPRPSFTPSPTLTQTATPTPTSTNTPTPTLIWYTSTPSRTPTSVPAVPADTQVPPTEPPPPPATLPPPAVLESCEVDPSSVQPGFAVILTFIAHFSAPGYSFDAEINGDYPGAGGCSGVDDNGDGTASCDGSSGMIPSSTTVDVTFSSSVGDCVASYGSP